MIALIVVLLACIAVLIGFVVAVTAGYARRGAKLWQLEQRELERNAVIEALQRRQSMRVYDREAV